MSHPLSDSFDDSSYFVMQRNAIFILNLNFITSNKEKRGRDNYAIFAEEGCTIRKGVLMEKGVLTEGVQYGLKLVISNL